MRARRKEKILTDFRKNLVMYLRQGAADLGLLGLTTRAGSFYQGVVALDCPSKYNLVKRLLFRHLAEGSREQRR